MTIIEDAILYLSKILIVNVKKSLHFSADVVAACCFDDMWMEETVDKGKVWNNC